MTSFQILGLPETAGPEEIEAKWRELRSLHHPDRGGNPDEFDKARKAYKAAMEQALLPKICPTCNGEGTVKQSRGFSTIKMSCQDCHGVGVKK